MQHKPSSWPSWTVGPDGQRAIPPVVAQLWWDDARWLGTLSILSGPGKGTTIEVGEEPVRDFMRGVLAQYGYGNVRYLYHGPDGTYDFTPRRAPGWQVVDRVQL